MSSNRNHHHIYDLCKKHMHAYILAETNDGQKFDGIVTGLDDENVYLAVPVDANDPDLQMNNHNQSYRDERYGFGGYGYPGYTPGYGYGYGYGYGRPRRRFNRLILPLAALTALSVLPWY